MSNVKDECDKAIAAHASWKAKFKKFLSDEMELDGTTVRLCDACEFGKWLSGHGRTALASDYVPIFEAHKHFHEVAADIVEHHKAGRRDVAASAVALGGAFTQAGAALTKLVVAVRDKAA